MRLTQCQICVGVTSRGKCFRQNKNTFRCWICDAETAYFFGRRIFTYRMEVIEVNVKLNVHFTIIKQGTDVAGARVHFKLLKRDHLCVF